MRYKKQDTHQIEAAGDATQTQDAVAPAQLDQFKLYFKDLDANRQTTNTEQVHEAADEAVQVANDDHDAALMNDKGSKNDDEGPLFSTEIDDTQQDAVVNAVPRAIFAEDDCATLPSRSTRSPTAERTNSSPPQGRILSSSAWKYVMSRSTALTLIFVLALAANTLPARPIFGAMMHEAGFKTFELNDFFDLRQLVVAAATASVGAHGGDADSIGDGPDIEWRDAPGGGGNLQLAVRDRALLNQASFIDRAATSSESARSDVKPLRHFMRQQGITLSKPTQLMLQEFLEMQDEARGAITPENGRETQQAAITQMRSVEGLLDGDTIRFENSIGVMNLQQFFGQDEKRIIADQYIIDDILAHRVVQLANMTCQIVYDDAEQLKAKLEQPAGGTSTTTFLLNPRNNPQFIQFRDFYELNKAMFNQTFLNQMKNAPTSANSSGEGMTGDESQLEHMSPFFQEAQMRPKLLRTLQSSLNFSIQPTTLKHTTVYAEQRPPASGNVTSTRISYKSAKPRFLFHSHPYYKQSQLSDLQSSQVSMTAGVQQVPVADPLFLPQNDMHHRDMQIVDDLVVDIINQKEHSQRQVDGGSSLGLKSLSGGVTKDYKDKYYNRKACEDGPDSNSNGVFDEDEEEDLLEFPPRRRFQPLFGSFARELMQDGPADEKPTPPTASVYDYPVEEIAITESQRILRKIMSMRALHLHKQNFDKITKHLEGVHANLQKSIEDFQKMFFTYEDPEHIKKMTQGIEPQQIQELTPQQKDAIYFENAVDISPRRLLVREPISLLTPYVETIKVKNERPKGQSAIVIMDVMTSSPDVDAHVEADSGTNGRQTFPISIKPGESVNIRVTASPENYGRFDALVYIVFKQRVFVTTFRAHVQPNKFGLEPIYLDRVPYLTQVSRSLVIANPFKKDLKVDELYLTNKKFEVKVFKLGIAASSNVTFGNLTYSAREPKPDYEHTMVSIRFSSGDYVRVPVYARTVNNLVEMTPQIIDFGLVQLNQQPLKIDIWLTVNINSVQKIADYYLPTDEENLDFALLDPVDLSSSSDKKQRKMSERFKRQRKACIDNDGFTKFLVGSVFLNPVKPQFIATSIKMELELRQSSEKSEQDLIMLEGQKVNKSEIFAKVPHNKDNQTIFVELPIIASVVNHSELFSAVKLDEEQRSNSSEPLPLYAMDLSAGLEPGAQSPFEYEEIVHRTDLVIKNNFAKPMTVRKIFQKLSVGDHENQRRRRDADLMSRHYVEDEERGSRDFYSFNYHNKQDQLLIKLGRFQQDPGQSVSYGLQTLRHSRYHLSDGRHLIWLKVSLGSAPGSAAGGIIIPQQVQAYSKQLLCQWQTVDHADDGGVQLCHMLTDLRFGDIVQGLSREKLLKIANPNPIAISLEHAIKSEQDDVTIELVEVRDRRGNKVDPIWRSDSLIPLQAAAERERLELMSSTRIKKYIGLKIQPFEQVFVSFRVVTNETQEKSGSLHLSFGPAGSIKPIVMQVTYTVLEGAVQVEPASVHFEPSVLGSTQKQVVVARANFSKPIYFRSASVKDHRFSVDLVNEIDEHGEQRAVASISFDAALTGLHKRQAEFHKMTAQYGIEAKKSSDASAHKSNGRTYGKAGAGNRGSSKGSSINKKINDEIADRERLDRANERFFEYFKQTGPGEYELRFDRPDNNLPWLHVPWPPGVHSTTAMLSDYSQWQSQPVGANAQRHDELSIKELEAPRGVSSVATGLFGTVGSDFSFTSGHRGLNFKDILTWADRERQWAHIVREGLSRINTTIDIETDVQGTISVPLTAHLKKPRIVVSDELDFGNVQIGQSTRKDIYLENPTNQTVEFQVYISYDLEHEIMKASEEEVDRVDSQTYRNIMQRHIDLYMAGIDIKQVTQIDVLFETFRQRDAMPPLETTCYTSSANNGKKPLRGTIVDLLLRFSYEHDEQVAAAEPNDDDFISDRLMDPDEFSSFADFGDLASDFQLYHQMQQQEDTVVSGSTQQKASSDETAAAASSQKKETSDEVNGSTTSLDEVLAYYQWFRSVNGHNFVSKYCVRIFQEHLSTWPYDDLETILSHHVYESELLISDRKGTINMCAQAIRHIHLLNLEKSSQNEETAEQCSRHDFAIESIQNHYRVLYQQVYDQGYRIEKCMEVSKIEKPFQRASGVNLQQASTVRSLVFFDSLMGWKKRELEIERYDQHKKSSLASILGANARLEEQYANYLAQAVPLTSAQFQRQITRDFRSKLLDELQKIDVQRSLYKMRKSMAVEVSEQDINLEQISRAWESVREKQQKEYERAQAIQQNLDLTQISLLANHLKDMLLSIADVIGQLFYRDLYDLARLTYSEQSGLINPMSGIHERFKLKNEDIHSEMVTNNVQWMRSFIELRDNTMEVAEAGLGAQNAGYFNEEIRLQMLNFRLEQSGKRLMPGPFQVQQFYLNSSLKGQTFTLAPGSNMTLKGAVIFEPQTIEQHYNASLQRKLKQKNMHFLVNNIDQRTVPMHLLIKNNMTHLEHVDLKGRGATAYLEVMDVQKEIWFSPENETDLVSVSQSSQVLLRALADIVESHPTLEQLDHLSFDDMQQLDRKLKRKEEVRRIVKGTDFHVINSLFSEYQTRFEYADDDLFSHFIYPTRRRRFRSPFSTEDDAEQEVNRDLHKLDPHADQDLIAAFQSFASAQSVVQATAGVQRDHSFTSDKEQQEKHLRRAERSFSTILQEQNFQNYILLNIPMTDIFRAPTKKQQVHWKKVTKTAQELVDLDLFDQHEDATQAGFELYEQCSPDEEVATGPDSSRRATLFFMDDDWVASAKEKIPREQIHIFHDQRRKRSKFKEKTTLRQVIAAGLNMWDRQDLRVDVNWTRFHNSLKLGEVDIHYEQKRFVVVQNTGMLPLKLTKILLDGEACTGAQGETSNKISIGNCAQVLNTEYAPGANITIELLIKEDYRFSMTRRILTIESEFFVQKFVVDLLIPDKAINLVSAVEKQIQRKNEGGSLLSIYSLIGNIIFMLAMFYFTFVIASVMKRDLEEQVSQDYEQTISPDFGLNLNASAAQAHRPNVDQRQQASRSRTSGRQGGAPQRQQQVARSGDASTGDIIDLEAQMNEKTLKKEFNIMCQSSFVAQVLPAVGGAPEANNQILGKAKSSQQTSTQSHVLACFNQSVQIVERSLPTYTQDALDLRQTDLEIYKAQRLATQAAEQLKRMESIEAAEVEAGGAMGREQLFDLDDSKQDNWQPNELEAPAQDAEPDLKNDDSVEITRAIAQGANLTKKQRKQLQALNKSSRQRQAAMMPREPVQAQDAIAPESNPAANTSSFADSNNQAADDEQEDQEMNASVQVVDDDDKDDEDDKKDKSAISAATKKPKQLKGLSRKEMKKKEQRLKREQELVENAKRSLELQQQQAERQKQIEQKLAAKKKETVIIEKPSVEEPAPAVSASVPIRSSSKKDDDFEIKSYHSSEEEDKKRQKQVAKEKVHERREQMAKQAAARSSASDDFPLAVDVDADQSIDDVQRTQSLDQVVVDREKLIKEPEPESQFDTQPGEARGSSQYSAAQSSSSKDDCDEESKELDVADEHHESPDEGEVRDVDKSERGSARSKSENSQDNLPLFQERRFVELTKNQAGKKKKAAAQQQQQTSARNATQQQYTRQAQRAEGRSTAPAARARYQADMNTSVGAQRRAAMDLQAGEDAARGVHRQGAHARSKQSYQQARYGSYYLDDYYDEEHDEASPRRLDLGLPPQYDDEDDEYYGHDARYDYPSRHFGTDGSDEYYRGDSYKKYAGQAAHKPYAGLQRGRYDDSGYYARQQPSRAHRARYEQSYEDPYMRYPQQASRGRGRTYRGRGIMDEYKSRYGGASSRYEFDAYSKDRADAGAYYDSHVARRRPLHGAGPAMDYVKAPPYIPGEYYDNEEYYQVPTHKKGAARSSGERAALRVKHSSEESLEDKKDDQGEQQRKYDHDQVMLNRRARARNSAAATEQQDKRRVSRKQASAAASVPASKTASTRGGRAQAAQRPPDGFKFKARDRKEAAGTRAQQQALNKSEELEEIEERAEDSPLPGLERRDDSPESKDNDDGGVKQDDEFELPPEPIVKKKAKTAFETLMDVSSIFSNPMLSFGARQDDYQDEPDTPEDFEKPTTAQRLMTEQPADKAQDSSAFDHILGARHATEESYGDVDENYASQRSFASRHQQSRNSVQKVFGQLSGEQQMRSSPALSPSPAQPQHSIFSSGGLFSVPIDNQEPEQLHASDHGRSFEHDEPQQVPHLNLFRRTNATSQQQHEQLRPDQAHESHSLFSSFGQGLWEDQPALFAASTSPPTSWQATPAQETNQGKFEQFDQRNYQQQARSQAGAPAMVLSQRPAPVGLFDHPEQQPGESHQGAGLSSSSLANLRKRAQDAHRELAMQQRLQQEKQRKEQMDQQAQRQLASIWSTVGDMNNNQTTMSATTHGSQMQGSQQAMPTVQPTQQQPRSFMGLGTLPVPKFLQERAHGQRSLLEQHLHREQRFGADASNDFDSERMQDDDDDEEDEHKFNFARTIKPKGGSTSTKK